MAATTSSSLPMIGALRRAIGVVLKLDSRTITLSPHTQVKGQGGTYSTVPQPDRAPQKFNIAILSEKPANVDGANAHPYQYEMSGAYDAAIAVGDTWQDGDSTYRVVQVEPKNDYETRAIAVGFGPDLNYGS